MTSGNYLTHILLALALIIALLCSSAAAEDAGRPFTVDEQAYDAYLDIATVYDESVAYLTELSRLWTLTRQMDETKDANLPWLWSEFFANEDSPSILVMYLSQWGDVIGNVPARLESDFQTLVSAASKPDDLIWLLLRWQEEAQFVRSPASLQTELDAAMAGIRTIMTEDRSYPFLKDLQDYYKEAVVLQKYAADFSDTYANFNAQLKDFQATQTSREVDFEFIFFADDFDYVRQVRAQEKLAADQQKYDAAVSLQESGQYTHARSLFWQCIPMEGTYDRMHACSEKILAEENAAYQAALDARRAKYAHMDAHKGSLPQLFRDGMAAVVLDGQWVYIDTTGHVVLAGDWQTATTFVNGYAFVSKDAKKYTKIDVFGNPADNKTYTYEQTQAIEVRRKNGFTYDRANKRYLNAKGEVIAKGTWRNAWDFHDGYAFVLGENGWGVIDETGAEVLPCEHQSGNCGEGYFIIIDDDVLHIYDTEMNLIF